MHLLTLRTNPDAPPLGCYQGEFEIPWRSVLDGSAQCFSQNGLCFRCKKTNSPAGTHPVAWVTLMNPEHLVGPVCGRRVEGDFPAANQRHFPSALQKIRAARQSQFRLLAFRDVLPHTGAINRHPFFIEVRFADLMQPAQLTLRRYHSKFMVQLQVVAHSIFAVVLELGTVNGVNPFKHGFKAAIKRVRRYAPQGVNLVRPGQALAGMVKLPIANTSQTLRIQQLALRLTHRQKTFRLFLLKLVELRDVTENHQPTRFSPAIAHGLITDANESALWHHVVFHPNTLGPAALALKCLVQR